MDQTVQFKPAANPSRSSQPYILATAFLSLFAIVGLAL